jgi:hypothetical protein
MLTGRYKKNNNITILVHLWKTGMSQVSVITSPAIDTPRLELQQRLSLKCDASIAGYLTHLRHTKASGFKIGAILSLGQERQNLSRDYVFK